MSDLTEERIREIVREELADLADHMAESSVTHSAEMAVAKAAAVGARITVEEA